ncbi:MAG: outer membrane autotransporter, partial [Candidatus Desulfovibrio kirbyi]
VMSDARLDTYAKYFLTQMDGDSVRITTGEPVEFETVTSRRLRLGTRFTYAINEYVSPYIGVGYEREFDGQVNASTYGYDLDAPSLRGDTGLGEIGLTITPAEGKAFSLNVGLQGFTGVREGWQGSLQMKYEF